MFWRSSNPETSIVFVVAAAWPMGGGFDDGDETWTNQSWQSLRKYCARRWQPNDLTSPQLSVALCSWLIYDHVEQKLTKQICLPKLDQLGIN